MKMEKEKITIPIVPEVWNRILKILIVMILIGGMLYLVLNILYQGRPNNNTVLNDTCTGIIGGKNISVLVAGDAIITKSWSQIEEKEFLQLIDKIRDANVSIVNLEMTINDFQGYPQVIYTGGTYLSARATIANELKWAGFDMVTHANNHAFDYGSEGLLKNLEYVRQADIILAGSGKDLQSARSPAYFNNQTGTVALISAASTFIEFGRASSSRPDFQGRPGINPLTVNDYIKIEIYGLITTTITIPIIPDSLIEKFVVPLTSSKTKFPVYQLQSSFGSIKWYRNPKDVEKNLEAIREAKSKADIVIMSVHAHEQGTWLEDFAHNAIDSGADIFLGSGPHETRGIEIYKCKPIFYSLGDFVFQVEQVEFFPSEYYEIFGLNDSATAEDAANVKFGFGKKGYPTMRDVWKGAVATIYFEEGLISKVQLIPVDLGYGQPLPIRGRPKYSNPELGKIIISDIMEKSYKYGTKIDYIESENIGIVNLNK